MNFNRRNLQTQELIGVGQLFVNHSPPENGSIRAVYVRQNNNEWKFVVGKCVLAGNIEQKSEVVYRDYAFLTKPVTDFTFDSFISMLKDEGYLISQNFPPIKMTCANPNWTEELVPSHITGTGLPARKFSATITQDSNFVDTQLVAYGMPFHSSPAKYIKDFLGLQEFHGTSDGRKGELSIQISDRRGAIHLENGHLSFAQPREDLCLVGQINEREPLMLTTQDSVSIENNIRNIELWLVSKSNEIIDYRSSTEWPYKYEVVKGGEKYDDLLKTAIHKGENETCEFKAYIDVGDKNSLKASEIERTVCAFSNLRGGQLLIGVDDEAEVVGLTKDLAKQYGGNVEKATEAYAMDIRARLRESLKDNQCFTIKVVKIYAGTIIVITVSKSPDINFLLNSNQAYVRRGATNVKMSPLEIRAATKAPENSLFTHLS